MACRTTALRACLSQTLTRAPVASGWRSRSDEVAFGGEELHEVTVAGCSELKTPERDRASRWKRIRNAHRVWVGSARHSWRSNGRKRENVTQTPLPGAPTIGVLTRGSGSQLVNAACFLVPDDDTRGNTITHGLSLFRPQGRTSSKGGVRGHCIILTQSACSRGYKRGERGKKAPKSLLEEESGVAMIVNVGDCGS